MAMYDFDTLYPRVGRASEKWDAALKAGCPGDAVPLSVADMEFRAAPEIIEAVQETAAFGLWGYTHGDDAFKQCVAGWFAGRHGWQANPEWIVCTSGVVPAIYAAVRALTQPGDRILVQPPVYPPFFAAVEKNGRTVLENPLVKGADGRYHMDFEDLRRKAPLAQMLVLCSPHNPVGRVWTREELLQVAEICYENKVLVFADEIHCDILMPGQRFVPFGTLGEKYLPNLLVGTAASKTFSLAGLATSSVFIPDPGLRRAVKAGMGVDAHMFNSTFGYTATVAAYEKGEPWLDELLVYLRENYRLLVDRLAAMLPRASVTPLEGTYLAWVNLGCLGLDDDTLTAFLRREACLYLNPGPTFGTGGEGHVRINLACPRGVLESALERLEEALKKSGLNIQ